MIRAVLAGGVLVSFPFQPVSWLLRLWALGWMLEAVATWASRTGGPLPSWRQPWAHLKRGASFFLEAFVLLLPASFLFYSGWLAGWIVSFERVRDYRPFGPVVTIAGILLMAACFVLLPMATVRAALAPGTRAAWETGAAWRLAGALPLRYFLVLAATMVVTTPLQLLRQPRLQSGPEFLGAGLATFGLLLAVKRLWAWHFEAAQAALASGRGGGRLARAAGLGGAFVLGILYGVRLIATQFLIWGSHHEWFAHVTFLLPGAPASLSGETLYW